MGHGLGAMAAVLISLAAIYFAGAFVSAKLLKREQWPFTAKMLD